MIDAWGRIEVHEAGVRVQHARVAALLVESTAPREHLDIAGRAAATYGVELMCLSPRRFDAYLASEVRGLDKPFIERLLMSDRRLCFEPRSVSYISRRGEAVGGFGFVEPDGEHPKRFQKLLRTGSLATQILRVAGAKYHDEALQRDEFTPGRELALVPEPDNPRDPAAISVWDAAHSRKVGYVPRELAPELGARLAAGRIRTVRSVWQWRDLRSGRRTGLHMLVTPTSDVTFAGGEQLEVDAAA